VRKINQHLITCMKNRSIIYLLVWAALQVAVVAQTSYPPLSDLAQGRPDTSPDTAPDNSTPLPGNTPVPTGIPTIQNFPDQGTNGNEPDRREMATRPLVEPVEQEKIEFQDAVTIALGQKLPVFGRDLFIGVPSTFAPVANVPVPSAYVLGPGDEVIVRAWGQVDIRWQATIDRNGDIFMPRVGQIHLAGVKFEDLQGVVNQAIGRIYKNFQSNVSIGRLRSIQIFVVGHVRRPGSYTVSSLSTMMNAIFATGGPKATGSLRGIELRRGDRVITVLDLYDLLLRGDKSKDRELLPGDVIFVPPVKGWVAVAGSVNNPAIYEVGAESTVGGVLSLAGGLTTTAAGQTAMIDRISERTVRTVDQIRLDNEGLRRPLRDGDLVRILPLTQRYENTVTLRGNVAVPGRYPWHPGMKVADLIPNRMALVTEQFWLRRNSALAPERQQERSAREEQLQGQNGTQQNQNQNEETVPGQLRSQAALQNEIRSRTPEVNWEYAVIQRLNEKELTSELIPFNLRQAIDEPKSDANVELQSGDMITIFSQADLRVPLEQQSKVVRMEGEFARAGVYKVQPGETLQDLVRRAGGFSHKAYLFGSVFTRESTRISQQEKMDLAVNRLGEEVERSASYRAQNLTSVEEGAGLATRIDSQRRLVENLRKMRATGRIVLNLKPTDKDVTAVPALALEDGDRFYVPPASATVTVLGAVYNANDFIHKPDLAVRDYLRQSGGPTRTADKGHIYVVKADGSVRSNTEGSWFVAGLEGMRLHPGDTIVVPEKLDRVSFMRNLRDYTQIFYQFALGAAAINVLK
jgi:polysaccharide biosynthesis/export protein